MKAKMRNVRRKRWGEGDEDYELAEEDQKDKGRRRRWKREKNGDWEGIVKMECINRIVI